MNVQHSGSDNGGRFFIEENGKRIGEMLYAFHHGEKLVINHTEVSPEHEGKGLGKALLKAVVDFARNKNFTIIPVCPYAKAVLMRTKEYADVLAKYVE